MFFGAYVVSVELPLTARHLPWTCAYDAKNLQRSTAHEKIGIPKHGGHQTQGKFLGQPWASATPVFSVCHRIRTMHIGFQPTNRRQGEVDVPQQRRGCASRQHAVSVHETFTRCPQCRQLAP